MKKGMKTFSLSALVAVVAVLFVISIAVAAPPENKLSGAHYNLNIIGFSKCTKTDALTDPDCFKGNAGDIETSGHTIFVPIKTLWVENPCDTSDENVEVPSVVDLAYLQKGVRILVSDAGGEDIQVVDRDATDGTAKLNLPDACYDIYARALGKPGGCMDIDSIICYDLDVNNEPVQVDCSPSLDNFQYVRVGHLDVDRIKGVKPTWTNATDDLLPAITGVGAHTLGYLDFFWQIFNNNLRLLQLRIYEVECPVE